MRKIFLLMLLPLTLYGQRADSLKQYHVIRFADGVVNTYASPLKWKGKDWLILGGIAAGTAALTLADVPVRNFWQDQQSQVLDNINEVGFHYGKPYSGFIFTGGFYLAGMLTKNEWAKETGLMLGTGLLTTSLIEMALKPAIGRARPGEGMGNYEVTFFNKRGEYHSFPSGHASIAFTLSFILARRVKSVPLKILFYSLAGSTVICRLYSDAHWISDVAFAGTIAWFCSDFAIKRIQTNRYVSSRPKKLKWNVSPFATGLTVRVKL